MVFGNLHLHHGDHNNHSYHTRQAHELMEKADVAEHATRYREASRLYVAAAEEFAEDDGYIRETARCYSRAVSLLKRSEGRNELAIRRLQNIVREFYEEAALQSYSKKYPIRGFMRGARKTLAHLMGIILILLGFALIFLANSITGHFFADSQIHNVRFMRAIFFLLGTLIVALLNYRPILKV